VSRSGPNDGIASQRPDWLRQRDTFGVTRSGASQIKARSDRGRGWKGNQLSRTAATDEQLLKHLRSVLAHIAELLAFSLMRQAKNGGDDGTRTRGLCRDSAPKCV